MKNKCDELKFSVSICVYGGDNGEYFSKAMDSIISQTLQPNEIVLVVDGPIPKEIQSVIDETKSFFKNLKVIYLSENKGHGEARRIGLENCENLVVAIMDADDSCMNDRFEKQIKCFQENKDLSIVGGNITEFINNEDNIVGKRMVPQRHEDIIQYMKKRCPMNQVTVMFRKKDVLDVGGYRDWFCNEDYYLWLRMYLNGCQFKNLEDILVNVRVSNEMYQRRGGWKYFKSESKLQGFMRKNKIIDFGTYLLNVIERLIVQVLLPNKIRVWVFQKFAREN